MTRMYITREAETRVVFESQKEFWTPYYEDLDYMLERELEHMAAEIDAAGKEVEEI